MTILVAYAPTPEGEQALTHGVTEALTKQANLALVSTDRGDINPESPTILAARDRLTAAGLSFRVEHSVLADPGDAVTQVAQDLDAQLIVIGLRHRSRVGKLILGSTVQRILLDATCPILAVRADKL
jgi:nucleotide-binding universal stress UspA family protein